MYPHAPHVADSTSDSLPCVAIIGAGIAGLACARELSSNQNQSTPIRTVTVYDKSRGIGGRLATRRYQSWQWDHGTPFLSAQSPVFAAEIATLPRWHAAELAMKTGQIPASELAPVSTMPTPTERTSTDLRVGVPTMNAWLKSWSSAFNLHLHTQINRVSRVGHQWQLWAGDEPLQEYADHVVFTAPPTQTAALLPPQVNFKGLAKARMTPCWTLMIATRDRLPLPPAMTHPHPAVQWFAADHTKPHRAGADYTYVMHTTPQWSDAHLERSPDEICDILLDTLGSLVGHNVAALYATAHRWRFARTHQALGVPFLYDRVQQIGVAGDWCLGPNAEHAYISGVALAQHLIDLTNAPS